MGYEIETNIEEIKLLIRMLSPQRSNSFPDWMNVGFCLHYIDTSLLPEWIEFSRLSEKYRTGECEKIWKTMRYDIGCGINTLHVWAKRDNPEAYNNYWQNKEKSNSM